MNPEPPKLETTAAAVARQPWIAHGHDREGCLVISRGRSVQRLSPGTLILAQTAHAPLPA